MIAPGARPLALVTGASRGIGAAVAEALAPTHDLLLGGRDTDTLTAVAAELPAPSDAIGRRSRGALTPGKCVTGRGRSS